MPAATVQNVQRQVTKARRRLLVQTLLNMLVWCWSAALLLSTLWFLVQPWVMPAADSFWRWAVVGDVFALSTLVGVWLAWRRGPSHVEAALEVDRRFALKERATTSLTLGPELEQTPAGSALKADAEAQIAKVNVRQGFPVRIPRTAAVIPVLAVVLAVVCIFYNPIRNSSNGNEATAAQKVANATDIAEKFNKLKNKSALTDPHAQADEKLAEIDKLREKLLNQPFDPKDKDKLRERLQEMLPLEQKLGNRLDDLLARQDRNKSLQEKLKEMGKDPQQKLNKDGPAKELEEALNRGDLDKAQKEIMALADHLKSNKLTDEERRQLQKQLEEIQNRLDNLADLGKLKDQLRKDLADGKISQSQFEKLMAKAAQQVDDLWELHEIGKMLGECKGCLEDGEMDEAASRLAALGRYLLDFDPNGETCQRCQAALEDLDALMQTIRQGLGSGPLPGGVRPMGEDGKTDPKLERQKGNLNPKTPFIVSGVQKGGTFNGIPANQVSGALQQAQQDAPEAIERQQVPPDAAEMLRGYYENLGGNKKK